MLVHVHVPGSGVMGFQCLQSLSAHLPAPALTYRTACGVSMPPVAEVLLLLLLLLQACRPMCICIKTEANFGPPSAAAAAAGHAPEQPADDHRGGRHG
jgi:hypothetical protein